MNAYMNIVGHKVILTSLVVAAFVGENIAAQSPPTASAPIAAQNANPTQS